MRGKKSEKISVGLEKCSFKHSRAKRQNDSFRALKPSFRGFMQSKSPLIPLPIDIFPHVCDIKKTREGIKQNLKAFLTAYGAKAP